MSRSRGASPRPQEEIFLARNVDGLTMTIFSIMSGFPSLAINVTW